MPYTIGDEVFNTKDALTERCRAILAATPNGARVDSLSSKLLFELFQFHDEWEEKSAGGVRWISTQTALQGTRCFVLVKHEASIDISFTQAIRLVPSTRTVAQLPQALRDFRNAARTAVQEQVFRFRNAELAKGCVCPCTNEALSRANCAVDHVAPKTFDQLLFTFCKERNINPLHVAVGSQRGTIAVFNDDRFRSEWAEYHSNNAELRLLSHTGNLQLSKLALPWSQLWS